MLFVMMLLLVGCDEGGDIYGNPVSNQHTYESMSYNLVGRKERDDETYVDWDEYTVGGDGYYGPDDGYWYDDEWRN